MLPFVFFVKTALYRLHFMAIRKFPDVEKRHCATYS